MIANTVFQTFIETVVRKGVFDPGELARDSAAITEKAREGITSGKRVDRRAPWMSRVSGKGDLHHPEWENVSLMEHLVSVARGAVVFAELDLRRHDPDISDAELEKRLSRVAAVGFLHDIDKILEKSRLDKISSGDVAEMISKYHVDEFLDAFSAAAPPEWFMTMIDRAETSRSGRIAPGGMMLNAEDGADAQYVHLADRMDSIMLRDGPRVALEEMENFSALRTDVGRSGWKIIDIQQPLFPFLLEALVAEISKSTTALTGLPPLFETHHDGRMIAAIPRGCEHEILARALSGVQERFRGDVRITVNNRCYIDVHEARATVDGVLGAMDETGLRQKTFALNKDLVVNDDVLRDVIEKAAISSGFTVAWPNFDKATGLSVAPLPADDDEVNVRAFCHGATLSVALRCREPGDKDLAMRTLSSDEREKQLLAFLFGIGVAIPDEILVMDHKITRQSLIALLAGGFAIANQDAFDGIFGPDGLIEAWLDGDDDHAGINDRIGEDVSEQYIAPVRAMVDTALEGRFAVEDENAPHRCHFTNAPVGDGDKYASIAEGVYGLKKSAFSGRENRPESHRSSKSGTWLSPLARAEHNLRFRLAPRGGDKTQMLISSPSTSGLFASLTIGNMHEEIEVSAFEACTEDAKKVKLPTIGIDRFSRRLCVARFEIMPTRLIDILDLLVRIMKTSIRTCRPLHVFQGLPHPVRDRVYFDALPREIERGLGKSGFRIEELGEVQRSLETWHDVAKAHSLGIRLATEIMDPATRLGALCEAVLRIERADDSDLYTLKGTLSKQAKELIMNDKENPLVRYARAMTGYQRPMTPNDSQSVRERGMRLAIEAVAAAHDRGPMTRETIISAIAARVSDAAERESDKHFPKLNEGEPNYTEAMNRAAEIFADEIWPEVFHGRLPDSRTRIHAVGVYRVAFDRAHQMRKSGEIVFPFK